MEAYDKESFKSVFEEKFTYISGFLRSVRRYGNKTAMIAPDCGRQWTYLELNREVNRLANALSADGIGKGSVVMFSLQNSPEFVFCYLAAQKIGAVACPINFRMSAGEIALTVEDSKPDAFIYDGDFKDTFLDALGLSRHRVKRSLEVTKAPEDEFYRYVSAFPDTEPETDTLGAYDEVVRLYTSGTTSLPKGVPINNINEILSAHDVAMHFPLSPDDVTMNMTPWFHRGGLHSGGPCPTLYVGATLVVMRQFSPRETLRRVSKYNITFLIGVPSVLELLMKAEQIGKYDLSKLRGIVTMGSPLEKSTCIKLQEVLTPNIFNGYGTTESFWNTFLRPSDLPEMSGTAGRSCTDDDVRIVKIYDDRRAEPDDLAKKDSDEVGEIIISSPAKSSFTYYNNPEQTEKKFYKGFMYTGDLGTWDEYEFVTVVGRKDDMIISSGENIYPAQIEEILNEHPKVAESLVTYVADKIHGQLIAAYIIKADDSLTYEEITDYCMKSPMLSAYKRPRYLLFTDSLPFTATGKKMHFKAHAMAEDDLKSNRLKRI